MCGIVGLLNCGSPQLLERITDVQKHRGPDDRGVWTTVLSDGGFVGLGSRRLAILDLSPAGHMPMSNDDGSLTIVYNGEIYNFRTLRAELESLGHRFRSGSDTEVVLRAFEQYGPECVKRLNGMFAFAVWDNRKHELFLARDRFGIKPLYYFHRGRKFAFASEMKALLELPELTRTLNFEALNQYLTFLWVPDPLTLLSDIKKLPAGHYARVRNGEFMATEYWDLQFPEQDHSYPDDTEALAAELWERFSSSVRSQMISDVPLGAFLSAGLDSSSIVSVMAQHSDKPVRTYTITFPLRHRHGEIALDDADVARRTAEHFGCKHTEIVVETDAADLLPKLVWHMDDPTSDPAIITAYLVNREAKKDVTVLLSGVGGDELFGGYRKYLAHYWADYYQRLPEWLRKKVIEPGASHLPTMRGHEFQGYVRLLKKMMRSGSLPARERFLMNCTYITEDTKQALYKDAISKRVSSMDAYSTHLRYFDRVGHADFLNQMLYLDTKTFMTSLNLAYNDKMSMASSVEVRVPFLDHELAEWAAMNISPQLKLHGHTTKALMRKAAKPYLPEEVLRQRKAGFGAPVDSWLTSDLRELIDDVLSERQIRSRGLFDESQLWRLIREHRDGRQDWSLQVWQFLTLELWMRAFVDSAPQNTTMQDELPHVTPNSPPPF